MAHNCIEICSRIQRIREQKGIKQEDIAEFLGITASGYCKIENGKSTLSMITACKIATFLDIDLTDLINDEIEIVDKVTTKTHDNNNDKETEFYEAGIAFFKEASKTSSLLENWLKKK